MKPLLSILTPAVWSRRETSARLAEKLQQQIGDLPVEHLMLFDNRWSTIGAKRNALLRAATGAYVAFVDDDDDVAIDYIPLLITAIQHQRDVITFRQICSWNGAEGTIHFSINHADELFVPNGVTHRRPWQVCAWKRELATAGLFTEKNWGEDADWVNQVAPLARSETHINSVLHYYTHTDSASLAMGG